MKLTFSEACAFLLACFMPFSAREAHAQQLLEDWWQPDGAVYSVVEDQVNGRVYIGGDFQRVGPPMYGGTPLDRNTGLPVHTAPLPNDQAHAVVPDGQGGYYLAGSFTAVGGQPRNRIAHVSASGQLLPFGGDAGSGFAQGRVERMLKQGNTLYAVHRGEEVTTTEVEGYTGPISTANGAPLWSNAVVDGPVAQVLPAPGSGWYLVGGFRHVAGLRREGIARVSANGAVHPWDPQVNGPVTHAVIVGDVMYLSGCFNGVLGQTRFFMAAIDMGTGTLLPFNVEFFTAFGTPGCLGPTTVLPFAGKLYLRGPFEGANGVLGETLWVDGFTGQTATAPFTHDGFLHRITAHGGVAWITGSFTQINGEARNGFAMVDLQTGQLLPTPFTLGGGTVSGVLPDGTGLFLRGDFTSVNGEPRSGLARVELPSGQPTAWAPQVDAPVTQFFLESGVLYMSGGFTAVNGQPRSGIAALSASSGALTSWQPQLAGLGDVLGVSGNGVFFHKPGGVFTTLGPTEWRVVALNATTGVPTGWQVQVSPGMAPAVGQVNGLAVVDDHMIIAGAFTAVNGIPNQHLAKVILATGEVVPWLPAVNGPVRSIAFSGDSLYLCGGFSAVGGVPRSGLAGLRISTGELLPFNPQLQDQSSPFFRLQSLALAGNTLYVAGDFLRSSPLRADLAAVDVVTGALLNWAPVNFLEPFAGDHAVHAIAVSGDTLFVMGDFDDIWVPATNEWQDRKGVAALDRHTGSILAELQPLFGRAKDITPVGGQVFFTGDGYGQYVVSWTGGAPRAHFAALDIVTGTLAPLTVNVDNTVRSMELHAGSLFLAGPFTNVQGQAVAGVARLNAATGALQPFGIPVPWGGELEAFVVHGGRIFQGTATGITVHDAITGAALPWPAQPNGRVRALSVSGNLLYMGGDFTEVAGQPRMRLAAVDLGSGTLTPWAPTYIYGQVRAVAASSCCVAVSGSLGAFQVLSSANAAVLPFHIPMDDVDLPPVQVMAVQGDLLVVGDNWALNDPLSSFESGIHAFQVPSGSYTQGYATNVFGSVQGSYYGTTPGALLKVHIVPDRVYLGGLFAQLYTWPTGRFRHNLAVYERPARDGVSVSPRVLLGGPAFAAGLMSDSLRTLGLLPHTEPYQELGYGHVLHGGGEYADPSVFNTTGGHAPVDWVAVELRDANDATALIATRAALLRRDGQVVDVDGVSPVVFGVPRMMYHVAIRHRNHLGVMTAQPVFLAPDPATVDFTDPLTPTFGTEAQDEVGGLRMLWPGDANFDGVVKYTGTNNDRDAVLQAIGGSSPVNVVQGTYATEDVNLDGAIKYLGAGNDRDVILQTIGGSVPTAVRVEQVP
jgi:hypothetical protein